MIDVYAIEKNLHQAELEKIGSLVSNPVTQKFYINTKDNKLFINNKFDWVIEIKFLPAVTETFLTLSDKSLKTNLILNF